MRTLVELNIEPKVGMIVYALKGRLKHHVIEFGNRFDHYEGNKPVRCKYVHTVNEKGSGSWIEYQKFITNYSFVSMSGYRLKDLFKNNDFDVNRIDKIKCLIEEIENVCKE